MPAPSPSLPPYRPPTETNYFDVIWIHPAEEHLKFPPLHLMRVTETGDHCGHGAPYVRAITRCGLPEVRAAIHEGTSIDGDGPEATCSTCSMVQRVSLSVLDDLWELLGGFE